MKIHNINAQAIIQHSTLKYLVTGLFAFSVDYVCFVTMYYLLDLNLTLAVSAGFIAGFITSFSINRQWVFMGNFSKNINRQLFEYLSLLVFNYFFTVLFVGFLNQHGTQPAISKLLAMSLIVCWNYVLFRWVIFANKNTN